MLDLAEQVYLSVLYSEKVTVISSELTADSGIPTFAIISLYFSLTEPIVNFSGSLMGRLLGYGSFDSNCIVTSFNPAS